MKFPVKIEKFISAQEQLDGKKLDPDIRSLCKKFLAAANEVYRRTMRGEIDENPFGGDVAANMRRLWKEHNQEEPEDPSGIFEVLEVLKSWSNEAFKQALEDRAEGAVV